MEIEVKKIRAGDRVGDQIPPFQAQIYVDGKIAGSAENKGDEAGTYYWPEIGKTGLLTSAAEHCIGLPPILIPDSDGKPFKLQMSLEAFIDHQVFAFVEKRELDVFEKKRQKDMLQGILVGIPETRNYKVFKLAEPLELIMGNPIKREHLAATIRQKIIPVLFDGRDILNTNFPPDFIKGLRIQPSEGQPRGGEGALDHKPTSDTADEDPPNRRQHR